LIGKQIKALRTALKMTQKELGDILGKGISTISEWEAGKRSPDVDLLEAIADALHTTPAKLMGYADDTFDAFSIPGIERPDVYKVPLVGEIACGTPITAEENIEDYINVCNDIKCDFVLRCKGNSMAPKLLDGDLVMIRKQDDVQEGQIAAVLVDTEATLKHVYRLPGNQGVQLVSDNPDYAPQVYLRENAQLVRILGLAVGYQRMI